jgi:hypothetical protein
MDFYVDPTTPNIVSCKLEENHFVNEDIFETIEFSSFGRGNIEGFLRYKAPTETVGSSIVPGFVIFGAIFESNETAENGKDKIR